MLVFWSVAALPVVGTFTPIVSLLSTVEAGDPAQVFASPAGRVGRIDTEGWGSGVSSPEGKMMGYWLHGKALIDDICSRKSGTRCRKGKFLLLSPS